MKRTAIITGSASGIGLGIATTFLENGYQVMLSDINEMVLNQKAQDFKSQGKLCEATVCNVTNEKEIENLISKTKDIFGSVDILINNAGLQHVALIEDFPTEKFELLIKVQLLGPFMLTKHVLPIMKAQKFGRIINMSSINGLIGFAGKSAYNSAKHGLIGLTKVCALETAQFGITANAICPGYVDTPLVRGQLADLAHTRKIALEQVLEEVLYPLIPQKKLVPIEEIASLALFLASDNAKSITGQSYIIDAGYTAQ